MTIAGDPSDIKTGELQRLHGTLYILIVALRTDHVWSQIPVQTMTSKVSIKGIGMCGVRDLGIMGLVSYRSDERET